MARIYVMQVKPFNSTFIEIIYIHLYVYKDDLFSFSRDLEYIQNFISLPHFLFLFHIPILSMHTQSIPGALNMKV